MKLIVTVTYDDADFEQRAVWEFFAREALLHYPSISNIDIQEG